MTRRYTSPNNRKPGSDATVLVWLAAVAVCHPDRALTVACSVLDRMAWAAFELVRLALLMGHWQITSFLSEGSRILDILLQVGPCLWCLLHLAAGPA